MLFDPEDDNGDPIRENDDEPAEESEGEGEDGEGDGEGSGNGAVWDPNQARKRRRKRRKKNRGGAGGLQTSGQVTMDFYREGGPAEAPSLQDLLAEQARARHAAREKAEEELRAQREAEKATQPPRFEGRVGIGIDFGTSNSSVAIYDGKELRFVPLQMPGRPPEDFMPTAIYIDRAYQPIMGWEALAEYLRANAGRTIELAKEEVGEFDITVGAGEEDPRQDAATIRVQAHAFTDVNMPGRLFRSVKSWLGHENLERVDVFGKAYRITALITPIIKHLREQAEYFLRADLESVHMGRPVNYEGAREEEGGGESNNRTALTRYHESCNYAGLPMPEFYPEPVAAALSYVSMERPPEGMRLLCFDFGGGTLDLCILETTDNPLEFKILATHGIGLGGDAIDRLIYRRKLFPELGEGCQVRQGVDPGGPLGEFRFYEYADLLLNWQFTHMLNTPVLRSQLRNGIDQGRETRVKLDRLRRLITRNLSYTVFRAIEEAKIALSSQETAHIQVPQLNLNVPLTREEFAPMLAEPLAEIEECLRVTLKLGGLEPTDIQAVVRTGGSSRIIAVRELLERWFPNRVVEHQAFTSIAGGLAIADWLMQDGSE
jgi:hypothetical chaperone protein